MQQHSERSLYYQSNRTRTIQTGTMPLLMPRSSLASFWVWEWGGGGGQETQVYRHKKIHVHVTYVHERALQKHIFSGLKFFVTSS